MAAYIHAIFGEPGPTEILQWFTLMLCILVLYSQIRREGETRYRLAALAGFLGVGLMLMEDVLDVRFIIQREVILPIFGGDGEQATAAIFGEIGFYGIIGSAMITFFVLFYPYVRLSGRGIRYLTLGFIFYGVAAVASATRWVGLWYSRFGDFIVLNINPIIGEIYHEWTTGIAYFAGADNKDVLLERYTVGFWFMDRPVEETIELLGAVFLFMGIVYTARKIQSDRSA